MQFSNKIALAAAFLASTSLALPVGPRAPTQAGTAGSTCAEEGKVVCENQDFQVCASGVWSVSMTLAQGTDCSVFGAAPQAGEGTLPSDPEDIPISASSVAAGSSVTPTIPIPTATEVPTISSSKAGGGFHQSHGGHGHSTTQDAGFPYPTEVNTPPASEPSVEQPTYQQPTAVPSVTEQPTAPEPTSYGGSPSVTVPANEPSSVTSAPQPTGTGSSGGGNTTPGQLQQYSGPEDSFPHADSGKWVDFDTLWDLNKDVCDRPDNAGKGEVLKKYIQQVGSEAGIDDRIILAVILQESTCNIGVGSTNGGVNNPGIMQSHNGVSYDGTDNSILQMVKDGVTGTSEDGGEGLVQYIEGRQGKLYTGLRAYNSGPNGVDESELSSLPAGTGTASYCSDIANRLTGAKTEHM